jgi:ABC-type multidrug transport system fused ATPase/permease subunit
MNYIFIFIAFAIGLIILLVRSIKIEKANRLSGEKRQKESLEAEGRKELRAEETILEQREVRKHHAEAEEMDRKAKVERDLREAELRRNIKDRKDHEAEEKKLKIEENKENE